MIETNQNQLQQSDSGLNESSYDQELYKKIKTIQSLPDEVVKKFLHSKGKLKQKSLTPYFSPNEK